MRILKSKTIFTMFLFTLLTTSSILLCMYVFVFQAQPSSSSLAYTFQLVDNSSVLFESQNGAMTHEKNILTSDEVASFYTQQFAKNFPYLLFCIIFIMIMAAFLLWLWMRRQEQKKHFNIATTIKQLQDNEPKQHEEFYQELEEIRAVLDSYQEDQQRLHAYIMHEQKNMIMLIKARLIKEKDPQLYADIDHLKYSVDDVLTLFANVDSEKESIDLAYIVAWECDQYRQVYPHLQFTFDEEKTYTMLGKAYWLHRAIANLLDNAIKYGNNQPIEVSLRQEKDTIMFQIKDNGIGMGKDQLEHIFHYRYRIQNLKKDGFGIGLSLVAHTCELCDGVIWVKSSPAQGSTFHLSFPLLK